MLQVTSYVGRWSGRLRSRDSPDSQSTPPHLYALTVRNRAIKPFGTNIVPIAKGLLEVQSRDHKVPDNAPHLSHAMRGVFPAGSLSLSLTLTLTLTSIINTKILILGLLTQSRRAVTTDQQLAQPTNDSPPKQRTMLPPQNCPKTGPSLLPNFGAFDGRWPCSRALDCCVSLAALKPCPVIRHVRYLGSPSAYSVLALRMAGGRRTREEMPGGPRPDLELHGPKFGSVLHTPKDSITRKRVDFDSVNGVVRSQDFSTCLTRVTAAIDGQLGQHQRLGPDGKPILDDPRFLVYERTKLAVNVLSPIGFGLVKASIVVLYEGIFHNIRPFRYCAYVMLGLLFAWSISFFFANLFICYPVTALIEPFYGKKCVDRAGVFLSTLVTDLIFDILILLMPIPVVWQLHLPRKDRLGVLGMFLLGATVVAVSIARLAQLLEVNSQYLKYAYDQTYYTSPAFFWANIELAIAVVSACLPTLKPVLTFFFPTPPKPQTKQTDYIKITERHTSRSRGSRGSDNYSTEPGKGSIPLDAYDPEP
ncbi:hypothetical protein CHU98_g2185 [Xylaria longipes]|nr:hypothetical protein CHU98_g2185 [Xylaria longipes]